MKKQLMRILALTLGLVSLTGCVGTPVVYGPAMEQETSREDETNSNKTSAAEEGNLKTGLAVVTNVANSESAKQAEYDVTLVAVLVDDQGVIADCIIDGVKTNVAFDETGTITSDLTAEISSKNELGDNYGMVAYGGAKYEWNEQADALAKFAVGKTVEELKNGAIDETGKAPEGSDLASTATIYLGGYVSAIEEAVNNADYIGAQAGDQLKLASLSSIDSSQNASEEQEGTAQLDCDVTALTQKDGVITSCVIDSVQAKVNFDQTGTISTDLTAPVQTKNQLGENYGMVAWGGAIAEWNEQAASFAAYVTGKTIDEVQTIAVNEKTAPTEADLASSVTIAIGGFQELVAKAMQQ